MFFVAHVVLQMKNGNHTSPQPGSVIPVGVVTVKVEIYGRDMPDETGKKPIAAWILMYCPGPGKCK